MSLVALGNLARTAVLLPLILAGGFGAVFEPFLGRVFKRPQPSSADLRGKVVVVTGASAGVGKCTAARMARMGARVVLLCRDAAKAELVRDELEEECNARGRVDVIALELSSLASVRCAAAAIAARYERVDVLVLNAGLNANVPTARHPDLPSCSTCFGVNFVAQWLLYTLLARDTTVLEGAERSRVVCLSSVMHHFADPSAFFGEDRDGTEDRAPLGADYAESKLAMLLLARGICRCAREPALASGGGASGGGGRGPLGVAVNPGAVNSDIWRHVPRLLRAPFEAVMTLLFLTPDEGCATSVFAATDPALALDLEGVYLSPYRVPDRLPGRSGFDFVGPFAGPRPAYARLPKDERAVFARLDRECHALCAQFADPLFPLK